MTNYAAKNTLTTDLKSFARGRGSFQQHRLAIVRRIIESGAPPGLLSEFLRDALFRLDITKWRLFDFGPKDWDLCKRLLSTNSSAIEKAMLDLVTLYVEANLESVQKLNSLHKAASRRLLEKDETSFDSDYDLLGPVEAQSLFGLRLQCALNHSSTDAMRHQLATILPQGWARSRLSYPLIYHFAAHPPTRQLDSFLSYILTGAEPEAELLAIKMMLNPDAARSTSLSFKLHVGLMGHPYDAIEFALDHLENAIAGIGTVTDHLCDFARRMAEHLPDTRAARITGLLQGQLNTAEVASSAAVSEAFNLGVLEATRYAELTGVAIDITEEIDADRPYTILSNMRLKPYPTRSEFEFVCADAATWFFTEAGRLIHALLRMLYMIERTDADTEARDALRLLLFFGTITPLIAAAPSAMFLIRRLEKTLSVLSQASEKTERWADGRINSAFIDQRTWISRLQWRLRRLEDEGRIEEWLKMVREETRLRPAYLTGIHWHWVEEVLELHRLRPFRSFDGAYLFIHMELEYLSNPLRLRLILDPLFKEIQFDDLVEKIVREFGVAAPAIVRRYLTTQNMLASGQAPNYVAALDQRVRAFEACIKTAGFTPLLTEEIYKGEVRTLTTELLLTNVNAGKFEVPWDTFRKDANNLNEDLILAVESLRSRMEGEGQLTELIEIPILWPNGVTEHYKLRQRDRAHFSLIVQLIEAYVQHPGFGLEVILSGRFRHNHLLQELWSALAETDAAVIPSVNGRAQARLIEDYRTASETFVDAWCAAHMQTSRPDKPDGLFNLVPDQQEMDLLIEAAAQQQRADNVVDIVIEWIKAKLRTQVSAAGDIFAIKFAQGLSATYSNVRLSQLQTPCELYREIDVDKVHAPVQDNVLRRIAVLRNWFDGIDAKPTDTISLKDLSVAVEALFEGMLKDRRIKIILDDESSDVLFGPTDVKITFDMLREIYYNALRYGDCDGGEVVVYVKRVPGDGDITFSFTNSARSCQSELHQRIEGGRYKSTSDAVTRDRNSGRSKIAASAATLLGRDTSVLCITGMGMYELSVPLRPCQESIAL